MEVELPQSCLLKDHHFSVLFLAINTVPIQGMGLSLDSVLYWITCLPLRCIALPRYLV